MNTYDYGYILARQDMIRFGTVFAMDKLLMLHGELARGYEAAIKEG